MATPTPDIAPAPTAIVDGVSTLFPLARGDACCRGDQADGARGEVTIVAIPRAGEAAGERANGTHPQSNDRGHVTCHVRKPYDHQGQGAQG